MQTPLFFIFLALLIGTCFVSAEMPVLYSAMFLLNVLLFGFAFKYFGWGKVLRMAFYHKVLLTPFLVMGVEYNIVMNMMGGNVPAWLLTGVILMLTLVFEPVCDLVLGWATYRFMVWRGLFARIGKVGAYR